MRTILFGGLYWGSLVLGNYQMVASVERVPNCPRSMFSDSHVFEVLKLQCFSQELMSAGP